MQKARTSQRLEGLAQVLIGHSETGSCAGMPLLIKARRERGKAKLATTANKTGTQRWQTNVVGLPFLEIT